MIKTLRKRFIFIAFLSTLLVLTIIVSSINIVDYSSLCKNKDNTLRIISENGGHIPTPDSHFPEENKPERDMIRKKDQNLILNSELPYESRYFYVSFSGSDASEINIENVSIIDESEAVSLAEKAMSRSSNKGFIRNYRFLKNNVAEKTTVYFLDSTRDLETMRSFLLISVLISVLGLTAVLVLIFFFSKKAIRPISDSYERQKQFITDAGHEIKTPLTIINADIDVLEIETDLHENTWIDDIRDQTKRLTVLTNDLIFLSKMQEFETNTVCQSVDLSNVLNNSLDSFKSRAVLKNQSMIRSVTNNIFFECDRANITKLFNILIDNALKYSPSDSTIECHLSENKLIVFSIANDLTDNCSLNVDKMFDRFYRGDASRNSEGNGFGLGLSIAEAIVAQYKGTIEAKRNENRLTITIQLSKNRKK